MTFPEAAEHPGGRDRGVDGVAALPERLDRGVRAGEVHGGGRAPASHGGGPLLPLGERYLRIEEDDCDCRGYEKAYEDHRRGGTQGPRPSYPLARLSALGQSARHPPGGGLEQGERPQ